MPKNTPLRKMNAGEAVQGFVHLLMSRQTLILCSDKHEVTPVAELAIAYCDANKLPAVREGWKYHKPENTDHLTNVPTPRNAAIAAIVPPAEVYQRIRAEIMSLDANGQNKVLGMLIQDLKQERQFNHQDKQYQQQQANREEGRAYEELNQFINIVNGNFSML